MNDKMIEAMGARRREEEMERMRKRTRDIGSGVLPLPVRRHKRMCIKAQSDNPCQHSLSCGHGEPHYCQFNDCLEYGHYCAIIREPRPTGQGKGGTI